MQKKYDFKEVLKEYNEKYKFKYKLPSEAFNVVITHVIETNDFCVTYTNKSASIKNTKPLDYFVNYFISHSISWMGIKEIILHKEDKELNLKIGIWPSSKIRYAYLYNNYYAKNVGNLGCSCMRAAEMQKALNFYIKNKIRIVVVIDNNNKIHARALLWDNVKSTKLKMPFTYLDRVYARSSSLLPLFHDLAEENKWKRYLSTTVNEMSKNYYKEDMNIIGMCHLPFMDTFRYLYPKDNLLTSNSSLVISENSGLATVLNIHNNRGYYPDLDPDRTKEVLTDKYISKKDAIFIKRYNGYVLETNIADINGDYYSRYDKENITQTKLDGYILKENSANEVITNNLIDKTLAIHSVKYNGYIHKSNVISIEDEIYHKDDTDITCFEDEWYHISQCFQNFNREEYNEELIKQSIFFYKELSETWIPYAKVTKKGNLIPKKHTIIAYNLVYSGTLGSIEYQEVYCTNKTNLVQLVTGELIVNSAKNKKYLKKFNNKYYIRRTFELGETTVILRNQPAQFQKIDKRQLLLFK